MGVFHDFFPSYSHLLPNDDEAFEHFDSFISRRIDEVGLPFKLWKVYICNCARNVTMLYLLHTFPPPNSVKGSDIKRVEGWKVWKVLLHIVGQLPVLYHALIKNLKSISPLFLNQNNYHLHAWICSCITTMVVLISYLLLLDWLKLLLMSLLLLFLNAG